MKEYVCVQVGHHKKVAEEIHKRLAEGWRLHTYQATSQGTFPIVVHYLLFEKG